MLQVMSPHILHVLTQNLADDYEEIQVAQANDGGSSHSLCQVSTGGMQKPQKGVTRCYAWKSKESANIRSLEGESCGELMMHG